MRSIAITAFLSVLVIGTSVSAKDKKPVDPNKKICRQVAVTGSITPTKWICHTGAEWAQLNSAEGNTVDQMHDANRSLNHSN